MVKTAYVRAFALLFATAACWSLTVRADIYPAQSGWYVDELRFFGLTKPAACSALNAFAGGFHFTDGSDNVCAYSYDLTRDFCWKTDFGCHPFYPATVCQYDGTLSGSNCEKAPPCPSGQVRDPETGECGPTKKKKNLGARCDVSVSNPCNAGTGSKFQVEAVLRSGAVAPLVEQLSYNSRLLSDAGSLSTGAYGKGWKGHYERRVVILSTGVAVVGRPDGRELDFQPPSS